MRWGSVATAVGGQHAEITALFNTPGADPHEFEPSMADTAEIQDADVLVYNGGHYDAYVETAAAESNAITVNATAIALGDAAAAEHAGHDHAGHDHSSDDHDHASGANEHVFYDLAAGVAQVADQGGRGALRGGPCTRRLLRPMPPSSPPASPTCAAASRRSRRRTTAPPGAPPNRSRSICWPKPAWWTSLPRPSPRPSRTATHRRPPTSPSSPI